MSKRSNRREPSSSEESSVDSEEESRRKDLKERDEFAQQLKKKSEDRTRKMGESSSSKRSYEEAAKRLKLEAEDKEKLLPKLRVQSRREYLEKRKEDKVAELEADILDDEYLFGDTDIIERERQDREHKKILLKQIDSEEESRRQKWKRLEEAWQKNEKCYEDQTRQKMELLASKRGFVEAVKQLKLEAEDKPEELCLQSREQSLKYQAAEFRVDIFYYAAKHQGNSLFQIVEKHAKARELEQLEREREQQEYIEVDADELLWVLCWAFNILIEMLIMCDTMIWPGTEDKDRKPEVTEAEKKKTSIAQTKKSLPIYPFKEDLIAAIRDHQILIIEGETGSGKTTQIPQYLYDAGFTKDGKKIGYTQPRRLAVMSEATRVAEEMGVKVGNEVGYSIRFEDCTSERTVLKYMTDGTVHREFLSEPDLGSYSVMIIDEAHERTLHTDILFGLVKDIARFRSDFKLLICVAYNANKFAHFFNSAVIYRMPGQRYPVKILYRRSPVLDYCDFAVTSVLQIHAEQPLGDILVFLTGQEEIEACQEMLQDRVKRHESEREEMIILPIYANLPSDMQAKIFEPTPPNTRKVVLATNIAETSLTIDNILYVIDPGFAKQNNFNSRTGMETLMVVPISKASANQRTDRAGRVAPGKCYRLYTAIAYKNELADNTVPEIQWINLCNAVLMLKSLGINDLLHFDFLDPPPHETLALALEQLYALGALNSRGELTTTGRRMAEFPVDRMMAKMLLASEKYKCSEDVVTIAAMLSVNGAVFYRPKDKIIHADTARRNFNHLHGDHLSLMQVYNQWVESGYNPQWCHENYIQFRSMKRARDVREHLVRVMLRCEIEMVSSLPETTNIRKAITAGYFYHVARLSKGGNYKTIKHNQGVMIHPNSALFEELPRWVLYHELVFTTKKFMRSVIEIDSKLLLEVAPHYYKSTELEGFTNNDD